MVVFVIATLCTVLSISPLQLDAGYKQNYTIVYASISAYTASDDECGRSDGMTASEVIATPKRTIAMENIPFGTSVDIEGEDEDYVVEDRFGDESQSEIYIDKFVKTKDEAFDYGRQYKMVKIYSYNK